MSHAGSVAYQVESAYRAAAWFGRQRLLGALLLCPASAFIRALCSARSRFASYWLTMLSAPVATESPPGIACMLSTPSMGLPPLATAVRSPPVTPECPVVRYVAASPNKGDSQFCPALA